ncbi:Immediate-early protein 2 [Ornithinimicrobium cerasi]|uniref:Polyketide cyclase / dehydrase and lipid transport n=1 Tax=Ornithinimicrobium cerasi TaxID=2248773 RepID=A0A285VQ70_9MICO|nr:Immediate-early protein 2 [Ornithinimicrobium cerasi]SOC56195.1 hypothetical protein SAMN05421879_10712 [Ornithinimicrobium cerasi]
MPHPAFDLSLSVRGAREEVWERLWDLDRHTAAVPLTVVTGGPLGPGSRFVGRTALGPVGFDDVMVVREWDPPRRCVVEKVGTPLRGTIVATLQPDTHGRTRVRWRQSFAVTRLPDRLVALARPAVRAAYLLALRRITRPARPV